MYGNTSTSTTYTVNTMTDVLNELKQKIKPYMSAARYKHTLAVADECKNMAAIFSLSEEVTKRLCISAYLHDITKEMSYEEQLKLCESYGEQVDKDTLNSPKTLHALSAVCLIKRDFPEFYTKEITSPIRYHTTAKENMSLEEKIVYLSDITEVGRKYFDCIEIRQYFYSHKRTPYKAIDNAIFTSLKNTINNLSEKGGHIHIDTIKAYNAYLKSITEEKQ